MFGGGQGETMVGGQQASSPGHGAYLESQEPQRKYEQTWAENQGGGGPPPVVGGGTDNGQGYPGAEYGPDPMGAFEQAPHMSQYATMGGLMGSTPPIQQQQQRQSATPRVDQYIQSLMR